MSGENVESRERLISAHFQRTMQRRARWFLEGSEKVRSAAYGAGSGFFLTATGSWRVVVLTDRHIYLTKPGAFRSLGLAKVLEKHEIGAVHVWCRSRAFIFNTLWIGAEPVFFLGRRRRLAKLAAAANLEAAGVRE